MRRHRTTEVPAAAEPEAVPELDDTATAEQFAAEADRLTDAATALAEQAKADRDAAEAALAAGRARAAEVTSEAEQVARELATAARHREAAAAAAEARARILAAVATAHQQAEDATENASGLIRERDTLAGKLGGLDDRLAKLAASRAAAESDRQAALSGDDVDALADARRRVQAADELTAAATASRDVLLARLRELGDAGTGELSAAVQAVSAAQAAVRAALNRVFPDREEALYDADVAELAAALDGTRQRLAEESAAARRPRRQAVR